MFPNSLIAKAITAINGELAWKKSDIFSAIEIICINKYSILGGEVWAIVDKSDQYIPSAIISNSKAAIGIIKDVNGIDSVYSWETEILKNESWEHFVNRSKVESIEAIERLNAENTV